MIVYLSRTKNTKVLAEIIQQKTAGRIVEIEIETPYPEHYQTMVDQVAEENRTGYLPPLKTNIQDLESYDIIFVGFPTWGMQLPPPMKSFLSTYDLKGKTIIPFNTNAGYGMGTSIETIKQLAPNSKVIEGYSTQGGKERDGIFFVMEGNKEKQVDNDVEHWLDKIGLLK
ncbi:flavodoxin [Sphingobacterium mizutaii]|uniref:flavodoxin n=1 Tax=Sphingobacterium mizutaii TaxID=1010 RepID=UPI00397BFF00